VLFEFPFDYYRGALLKNLYVIFVVLAGRGECALGAPLLAEHHLGLQGHCRLLQVDEPLLLELAPDLIFHGVL
jgi:hypothetical protein